MDTCTTDLDELVARLSTLDPYKIVLFGSYAAEKQNEGNDIDLLVILDSETVSQNYEEKMKKKLMVRNTIIEINKRIPIDLIVYTRAEYEIIKKNGSSFLKEISISGKTLYEKAS